jgi:N-acetylmuramoyl-L-alanine amidase
MRRTCLVLALFSLVALAIFGFGAERASAAPLIVIDPGHSGSSLATLDPLTRIKDYESNNGTENAQDWNVALALKAKLEAAGYRVLLTKNGPQDTVSKRNRTDIADNNGAALAVSIHRDGYTFGTWGQIYVQRTDGYRVNVDGKKVYFSLPDVAVLSLKYGQNILAARRAIEGSSVVIKVMVFTGRGSIAAGTLPLVQLFSKTPWVYCEAGYPNTPARVNAYAQGIFNGIVASIPVDGSGPPPTPATARYESTATQIHKIGTWSTFVKPEASNGSYQRSATSGASATIDFNGTRLDIIAMTGTTTGIVDVFLDGVKMATVDTAAAAAGYQFRLWTTGDISAGYHTVKIACSPLNPTGKYLTLDAVDVIGAIAP